MKADRDEKMKGVALWWVISAIVLGSLLLVKFPMFLAKGLSMATVSASKKAVEAYRGTNGIFGVEEFAVTNRVAIAERAVPAATAANAGKAEPVENEPVYLTGMVAFGGKATVYLSDGRIFTSADKELEVVAPGRFAIIAGKRFEFAPVQRTIKETSSQSSRIAPIQRIGPIP